jgi:hypothetical protein
MGFFLPFGALGFAWLTEDESALESTSNAELPTWADEGGSLHWLGGRGQIWAEKIHESDAGTFCDAGSWLGATCCC